MRHAFAALVVLIGCGHDGPPSTTTTAESPPPETPPASTLPIPPEVLTRVCHAEPCGGDESTVELYRNAGGQVQRLFRLYGPCSHNPGIYFDPSGVQTELIPEQPVVRGSPEQLALQARHDAQIAGLTRGEIIRCSDGRVLPPRQP